MNEAVIKFEDLSLSEVFSIATDVDSVAKFKTQYQVEDIESFVFLYNGTVYGCMYSEPMTGDKLYRIV